MYDVLIRDYKCMCQQINILEKVRETEINLGWVECSHLSLRSSEELYGQNWLLINENWI